VFLEAVVAVDKKKICPSPVLCEAKKNFSNWLVFVAAFFVNANTWEWTLNFLYIFFTIGPDKSSIDAKILYQLLLLTSAINSAAKFSY
jgi:hypothetical protein